VSNEHTPKAGADGLNPWYRAPGGPPPPGGHWSDCALNKEFGGNLCDCGMEAEQLLESLVVQFSHAGCTCTFATDNCCGYAEATAYLAARKAAKAKATGATQ